MNLLALRTEVLNHGFDPIAYSSRINQYLNDAQSLIARRVDYYVDEASSTFSTVTGTALYPLPADLGRIRELFTTDINQVIEPVSVRDIDRSATTNGRPYFYALDGFFLHTYPIPDAVYPLELRYWSMPATLAADTDTPTIPADWHHMLWVYATWMCYEADDDAQMGQYWEGRFEREMSMFTADQKFPSSDYPTQAESMWQDGRTLSPTGSTWTLYGGY